MKHFLQTALVAFSFIFIASCSSDDPEPPHIVGAWTLEALNGINFPDAYSAWEEVGYTTAGYDLEINNDGTFVERIKRTGQSSLVLPGTWEFEEDGEDLVLTFDDEDYDPETYKVTKNELDVLWFTTEYSDVFISNANLQKLIDDYGSIDDGYDYLNSLDADDANDLAILQEYYQYVTFDLQYSLIRSE
ncbi:hypothetical protein N7E81_15640 [Reichenbachiella carrageenanivorans]|uniref:Lipocalin-like domain-containing protein n=1 Tax=Reichenbachiella carrageenanivorans TaxID=2979869 RepID=A0ABY6CXZ0_9BACT|nr:hypothetical protein [Reichenbachiella carrageenanivorans]UXX78791.1 hypothetical protein N7E81_15640 [Reichenbachiella carrageenanivorans]